MPCSVADCANEAKRGGLCWGHERRRRRGVPLSEPLQERGGDRFKRLCRAAIKFADDTERPAKGAPKNAYKRAEQAFYMAVYRYVLDFRGDLKFTTRDGKPLRNPAP